MPIYEYECVACKHRFEQYQTFSESAIAACPECGSAVRKILQPVGLVFKGSGWYKTDSRNATAEGKADAAKDSAAGASTEAKASGDAKADGATKPESSGKSEGSGKADVGKRSESGNKAESGSKPVPAAAGGGQAT